MRILIADDERFQHVEVHDTLESIVSGNEYHYATHAREAMDIITKERIDIAFLDIEMPGENGLDLAKQIMEVSPDTNIIMVTAYSEYALDALKIFVSGYIVKPVMEDDMRQALENLRNPIHRLTARCFGNFELFDRDGTPVRFGRQKSKELVAYLIALRGAAATSGEICASIFDEEGDSAKQAVYLRRIASDARKDLEKAGFGEVLVHQKNSYSIERSLIDCDYWNYLESAEGNESGYKGEFMNQYSWAEEYIYNLENYGND